MKYMSSAELRAAFLDFFKHKGHSIQPSSSLVPGDDPTLLFTNAGMVQFKDVFLGRENRPYSRAVTSQRCVRAGGKHNDLENVGYTARHHTFFEMLGNFSFGDYFKKEAIQYAWEFLTEVLQVPPQKLWVTIFDKDDDAEKIWLNDIGIDPDRLTKIGSKDNFWSMGDIGPCGPCTEIFYDHGENIPGGPPGSSEEDGDRYIEIWNLVFMQYNRSIDGKLTPLPRPSVDTGMGLERIAAVLQGVHNNYQIDLFEGLVSAAAKLAGLKEDNSNSLRVIADHIRSCAFLIADGVLPSNEGRGYVLRRIIRRAIRHGYRLELKDPFFYKLVEPLANEMGEAYPELVNAKDQVARILHKEEQRFAETLDQGMKILGTSIKELSGEVIPGDVVFLLYDTYGFPLDLTADFAREHHLKIDQKGFDMAMAAQKERARSANQFGADYDQKISTQATTEFTGYTSLCDNTQVLDLFQAGQSVEVLSKGEEGMVVLKETPFYAESGGQVGDRGMICLDKAEFQVKDTQKQGNDLFLHHGIVTDGTVNKSDLCKAEVDKTLRQATTHNHSATHLLHAALRQILGEHVTQKGSLVDPERLRFDFSHFEPITADQLKTIERLVNEQIRINNLVTADIMDKDAAMKNGAMALFGEKYGAEVRVLKIGDFSTELCGGTHVDRAGDIGSFKIISETGIAAGVRRIEAITGQAVVDWIQEREQLLNQLARLVKATPETLNEKVLSLTEKNKSLEKELEQIKTKLASEVGGELASEAIDVNGIKVLAKNLPGVDLKSMRDMVDQLKNKLGSAVIIIGTVQNDKVNLIAGVTKDRTDILKAGEIVNMVAQQVGGKGGGRPDMAQAGGTKPEFLDQALNSVADWIRAKVPN